MRPSPRVLIVAPRLGLGGAEIHLSRVVPRLRNAGLDISIFTIQSGGRLEDSFRQAGVPVFGQKLSGTRLIRDLRIARALRDQIQKMRPDILHCFLPEPYLIAGLASAGLNGFKRVMSRRSLSRYQRSYPLLASTERFLHRSMTALIGNSTAVATELALESGDARKVGIIHNGIDLPPPLDRQLRLQVRRGLGIPEDAFVVAVVANLIGYKGHSDLIDALAAAHGRLGSHWRLLLVGRDEGIGAALRAQARSAGIEGHIVWAGEVADSSRVLPAADIGVLPSHEEGFSNSLIEKMGHGLAVVATRVGGNIDAVVDGASGLLVQPHDSAALAAAILRLYDDAAFRERLGAAARARIERLFSIERCMQRYLNLYEGLVSSNRPVAELIDPSGSEPAVDCGRPMLASISPG